MAPERLSIASVLTFLSTAFLCLFLGGCSSGGALQTHRSPAEAVFSSNGEGAPGDGSAGTGQGSGEKGKAWQKKMARKKAYDKRAGGETEKSVFRENEAGTGGEALSLSRGDDAEDDNLASLFTEDYLRQFDIPIVLNDAVQYFVRYFTTEKRKVFAHWLRRSRRYFPMIREILRGHGLPEDLIYVAMIESGFNPKAYSSMKACGPWQFICETGGRYGLRVNHWVDERRDPEKSTVAAALYLKDLFNQFGSWYLAAAAYNAGEKRIERSVEMHETGDFWELTKYNTLPRETREYIPRLLAAALIAKDPEKFGFTGINYDQPVSFVSESAPGGAPLATLAQAASTDVETIKALNPEILTNITPPDVDEYTIRLPESTKRDGFREALRAALETEKRVHEATAYTFKRRDSLAGVMKRYKVGYSDLLLVNSCDQDLKVKAGTVLYIPRFYGPRQRVEAARDTRPGEGEAQPEARPPATRPPARVVSASGARTGCHIVKRGESLAGISARYGMDLALLKEINGLKKDRIRPNMRLRLTGRAARGQQNVRTASYRVVEKGQTKDRAKTAKERSRHKKLKARTAGSGA